MEQDKEHGVRPPETDYILLVTSLNVRFRRSRQHIVFLANRPVPLKIEQYRAEKFRRQAVGIFGKAIAPQTFSRDELQGRPAVRSIPLSSGFLEACQKSARPVKRAKVSVNGFGLVGGGQSNPERVEGGGRFI